jgi:predicted ATPase
MMKADRGDIWLDKSIHNNAKSIYKIKANKSISLKGFRGFTPIYSLLEKQEMRVSFFTGDLVGRKKELNRLSRYLRPIRNDKFGGIVTVYGEAGVGKSRLIYELIRKSEIRTLTGQCDSILKKSLNPFAYFLSNYFRQSETPNLEERKTVYSAIYNELVESADKTDEKELRRIESILGSVIGLYWEGSIYDMIEAKDKPTVVNFALKSFIKVLCSFEPLILLIEDLQWIDETSQEALQILTRQVGDVPFIILASSRFNDDGSKPAIKSDDDVKRREVIIKDLEADNIETLIENNLSAKPKAELVKYIRSRAEGNPFYIEQFCLYLLENDLISEPSTEWIVELVSEPTDIPMDINAVIIARVDRLSSELKDLVQVASVLGREFEVQVLEEVLNLLKEKETAGTQS